MASAAPTYFLLVSGAQVLKNFPFHPRVDVAPGGVTDAEVPHCHLTVAEIYLYQRSCIMCDLLCKNVQ
jgi:hypothetical protein